jgi:hypothetical protein
VNKVFFNIVSECAAFLRSRTWLKKALYIPLERLLRLRIRTIEYILFDAKKNKNVKVTPPPESIFAAAYPWTIGVIRDLFHNHESYMAACCEMKVAYKTIDLFATNWVDQIQRSGCAAFVAWPSECIQEWKRLYDERLRFLSLHMKRIIYPPYDALWLYGSKQRQRDWLDIHGFPHARTWVFYDLAEALNFLDQATLPLVAKLDIGSSAHGVWIIRTRREGEQLIRQAFSRGIVGERTDTRARQWRHILLQEYVPILREWRIISIGDSFFGHEKGKAGKFHSGSGVVGWLDPPRAALDLVYQITETGGFRSVAMDVFEQENGGLLVNELQSVFGAFDTAQMYIDGVPGRYRRVGGEYVFEEGRFCRNACCNLRIEDLLNILKQTEGTEQKRSQV